MSIDWYLNDFFRNSAIDNYDHEMELLTAVNNKFSDIKIGKLQFADLYEAKTHICSLFLKLNVQAMDQMIGWDVHRLVCNALKALVFDTLITTRF